MIPQRHIGTSEAVHDTAIPASTGPSSHQLVSVGSAVIISSHAAMTLLGQTFQNFIPDQFTIIPRFKF